MSDSGLGNFTKAVGKGMGGPCFRIFQTHFASQNNVGDVAAKEQVCTGSSWSKYGRLVTDFYFQSSFQYLYEEGLLQAIFLES